MKHSKMIAALATAGSFFAVGSAHAFVPAVAAGIAALAGAGIGSAAAVNHNMNNPPAVAVVPSSPTVVLGGPPATVEEVIPASREGYRWQRGHYEMRDGVATWVAGHWIANDVVIYEH